MTIVDAPRALSELPAVLGCAVALPGDPGYERVTPWNVAVPVRPGAVVFVTSARDVGDTVRFAAERGLRVSVQATGHGALAVGPDTIVVHTGGMADVTVDPSNRSAYVGAGTTWQQVMDAAAPHGLAPLAGSAPGVGVVGFLTGGGIGPLVRSVGLSSDHVRSFELVTGTGEFIRVTPDEHADLFWGLRGGKATLGIVTAVEIDLLPIDEFYGGALYFDGADAATVLHAWQRWCTDLPEWANTSVALQQLPPLPGVPEPLAGRFTVAVRYVGLGDFDAAARVLEPMRRVATPLIDAVSVLPYAALGAVHADPVDPMPVHEDHAALRELTREAVDALLAVAGPQAGSPQAIVELRLLGGAFGRPAAQRSAFCHRDAGFTLSTIGALVPPIADVIPGHAAAVVAALAPWATGGQFPNFAMSDDPARLTRVYNEDTLYWLASLAERYDPEGVLRVGQVARFRP